MPPRSLMSVYGEQAECAFVFRAMQHGLIVCKPYGNSTPYDFVVQARRPGHAAPAPGAPLWRIQVKSSFGLFHESAYKISTEHCGRPYTCTDFDFFAAWIAPLDVWYILPVRAIIPSRSVGFFPHVPRTRSKYEKYREAWELLL
ncbi:MAG: hypothetical protein LAN37_11225 [Acidobacteriia bacterium]|jgi:hypothetical protein|nr:hypothetical protein [Terriglobia bacterium]